ncbi:formate--tetrahydrofolate ligase [Neobacillus cucumis]|uniref:formate--tetrahydrofolate ligase n=1 Tax=Neobacillus cucumis TaxID=1740721 RepID=UPI002E2157BC|nr:formate--tetrahydrofolate ligase [Neobacillus cucumis]
MKTSVKSDIEISQQSKMKPILEIAEKIGLTEHDLDFYGKYKTKISNDCSRGGRLKSV